MTQERKNLKEIVDKLVGGIDRELKIREQEKNLKELEKENLGLRNKVSSLEKKLEVYKRQKPSLLGRLNKKVKYGFFIAVILGGLAYGGYKGCDYHYQKKERVEWKKKKKVLRKKLVEKDKQKIKRMLASFLETVNRKDREALKEYIVCQSISHWKKKERKIEYPVIEEIAEEVLYEGYQLRELKELDTRVTFARIISAGKRKGQPSFYRRYKVKIKAKLVSGQSESSRELSGLVEIQCQNKCKFRIKKETERFCPPYSHIPSVINTEKSKKTKSIGKTLEEYDKMRHKIQEQTGSPHVRRAIYLAKAKNNLDRRRFRESIKYLDQIIKLDHSYYGAYLQRGFVRYVWAQVSPYRRKENYHKAIEDFEQAIKIAPHDGQAYFYIAKIKERLGDQEGARREHSRLKKLGIDISKIKGIEQ